MKFKNMERQILFMLLGFMDVYAEAGGGALRCAGASTERHRVWQSADGYIFQTIYYVIRVAVRAVYTLSNT